MGIFSFRQKKGISGDVAALFPKMQPDGRELRDFSDFHSFDIVQHYNMVADSVALILNTKYPRTFFYRYQFAMEAAAKVISLDKCGYHGRHARQTLKVLRQHRAEIINAFLKRCCDTGKLAAFREEILRESGGLPEECDRYLRSLLHSQSRGA